MLVHGCIISSAVLDTGLQKRISKVLLSAMLQQTWLVLLKLVSLAIFVCT